LAIREQSDLRPNLLTLILAPWLFYLLLLSRRRAHWAWAAAAVIGLWANLHGGFTLGLGMLLLWTICQCGLAWRAGGPRSLRPLWPLAGATAAALALAGLANPFGLRNLTELLVVGRSSAWRNITDWQSIFHAGWSGLQEYWEFLTVVTFTAALSAAHVWAWRKSRPSEGRREDRGPFSPYALACFEFLLLVMVVYMGCRAQRFTPLAVILLAPLLAGQLEWSLQPSRRLGPAAAACLLAITAAGYLAGRLARHYSPQNPIAEPETFFERMIYEAEVEPVRLAQFINANGVEGRIFQEWTWEGYLHLECPQLSLWAGARAQQAYLEEDYRQERALVEDPAHCAAVLDQRGIHLIAIPRHLAQYLFPVLVSGPQGTWAVVYYDGLNFLLADCRYAPTAALVEKALASGLHWPSEPIAAASRALCAECTSNRGKMQLSQRRALLHRAIELGADPFQIRLLVNLAMRPDGTLEEAEAQFLAAQYTHWSALEQPRPGGCMVVDMCREMADALARHYQAAGHLAEARQWAQKAEQMERLKAQLERRWVVRGRT
jgi:hypothetical protein